MDGVLYDSMPLHAKAWRQMTLEMGMDIPEDEFYQYEGMTGVATIALLADKYLGTTVGVEEAKSWYQKKADYFYSHGQANPMPGAYEALSVLKNSEIRCILVTGSGQTSLINKLEVDYPGVFCRDKMVTSANVTHGKPHPEPFLKAVEMAGVDTKECIAIDNAPLGVESAHRAGIYTIGVKTGPLPKQMLYNAGADKVVEGMMNMDAFLKNLIASNK